MLRRYLSFRMPILVSLVLVATLFWLLFRPPVDYSASAMAAEGVQGWEERASDYISRVHGVWVTPERLEFLPLFADERGVFEAFQYIPMIFLAIPDRPPVEMPVESSNHDLFYVELAMNEAGVPIDSRRFTNVTRTPSAQEQLLYCHNTTVVVSSEFLGQIQSIHLYDFARDLSETVVQEGIPPWLGEVMIRLDNLHNTGRWDGADRRDYLPQIPIDDVSASASSGDDESAQLLTLNLMRHGDVAGVVVFDLATRSPVAGEANVLHQPALARTASDLTSWAANWLRNREWIGADRMAVIEQIAFGLSDDIHRLLFAWFGYTGAPPIEEIARSDAAHGAPVVVTRSGVADDQEWPPPPLEQTRRFDEELEGEGVWTVSAPDFVDMVDGAPPAFLQTYYRTDRNRPYAYVLAMAMDLRQLDIRYQQGTNHPIPTTGRRGSGEIPRDDATMDRLVAAFNGGFKTTHGAFGSMVDSVVYLEPMPWRATVAWTDDSDAMLMGTWALDTSIPEAVTALRQNMQPLYADGTQNPTRRRRWFGDNDADPVTVRSGLCYRGENTLIYFWSELASWRSLARTMSAAGCTYGMHLDMNPYHTGWEYYQINDFETSEWESARPTRDMWFHRERYLEADNKDFFYILRRDTFDAQLPALQGHQWSGAEMPTTSEGFLPLAVTVDTGNVQLVALDDSLLTTRFALGSAEPPPPLGAGYRAQPTLELSNPVVMLSFDAADAEAPRGLSLESWNYFPAAGSAIWLTHHGPDLSIINELDPTQPNRIELVDPADPSVQHSQCTLIGYSDAEDAWMLAWGPAAEAEEQLAALGVEQAGVMGCGSRLAQLERLQPTDDGFLATDLLDGTERQLTGLTGERSRYFFEAGIRGPRLRRLYMDSEGEFVPEPPHEGYEERRWRPEEL